MTGSNANFLFKKTCGSLADLLNLIGDELKKALESFRGVGELEIWEPLSIYCFR